MWTAPCLSRVLQLFNDLWHWLSLQYVALDESACQINAKQCKLPWTMWDNFSICIKLLSDFQSSLWMCVGEAPCLHVKLDEENKKTSNRSDVCPDIWELSSKGSNVRVQRSGVKFASIPVLVGMFSIEAKNGLSCKLSCYLPCNGTPLLSIRHTPGHTACVLCIGAGSIQSP